MVVLVGGRQRPRCLRVVEDVEEELELLVEDVVLIEPRGHNRSFGSISNLAHAAPFIFELPPSSQSQDPHLGQLCQHFSSGLLHSSLHGRPTVLVLARRLG